MFRTATGALCYVEKPIPQMLYQKELFQQPESVSRYFSNLLRSAGWPKNRYPAADG